MTKQAAIEAWFTGRVPDGWFTDPVEVAVDREEIRRGTDALGENFEEHLEFVIAAMARNSEGLGLGPRE